MSKFVTIIFAYPLLVSSQVNVLYHYYQAVTIFFYSDFFS